jgi:dihydrofolate synthase/folylpolyglutamate synthase
VLADQLRQYFPGRKAHAVFALMRDKDIAGVVGQMADVVEAWYVPPLQVTRAAPPESLRDALRSSGVERVECGFGNVSDAVSAACCATGVGDPIVVFGSFFLVAEYLAQHDGLCR